jgi:hypothetical protein
MSLIQSKSQLTSSRILDSIVTAQSHLSAAVYQLNQINRTILDLNDSDLADFGNHLGFEDMQNLSGLHAAYGGNLNDLVAGLDGVLDSASYPLSGHSVDIRPLAEKLAEQNRKIEVSDAGAFSVVQIPLPDPVVEPVIEPVIEPEPEPVIEPEPVVEEPAPAEEPIVDSEPLIL